MLPSFESLIATAFSPWKSVSPWLTSLPWLPSAPLKSFVMSVSGASAAIFHLRPDPFSHLSWRSCAAGCTCELFQELIVPLMYAGCRCETI